MTVHKQLGNGFQEVIYQRALEIEIRMVAIFLQENMKCLSFTEMNKLEQGELIFW